MRLEAFRDALHELGYVEGKNVQLEVRWGNGEFERLPKLAAELVQLKVDVIVAATITSTFNWTSSAAKAGSRSNSPFPQRTSS